MRDALDAGNLLVESERRTRATRGLRQLSDNVDELRAAYLRDPAQEGDQSSAVSNLLGRLRTMFKGDR